MMSTETIAPPEPMPDPFAERVFREPHRRSASVGGLNELALSRLLAQFERLHRAASAGQSVGMGEPAPLVVSPQPGYGKSHLIGRLFSELEGRATLIYVAPFQSASLCWQSILLRMVQELTFPDRSKTASDNNGAEPPTQLDAFAHGVLTHLIAGLIDAGKVEHADPVGAAAWLRQNKTEAFSLSDTNHPWSHWLRTVFSYFHYDLESGLQKAGVSLHASGWLRVLFHYAAAHPGDEARALALAWMSGQALEPAEASIIGLRTGELGLADLPDQINELCWRRLLDFCQLATFYRPFVFCFDQTEAYGHSSELARCFGMVIAQIHLLANQQMMVVTANQQPWEEGVAKYMENADKDRFTPLPLEGLNRAGAEELVRLRCWQRHIPATAVEAFLGGDWLQARFPTERNRLGIRQFLQLASTRWSQAALWLPDDAPAPAPAPKQTEIPTLKELHERYAADMRDQPKRLLYNADALRWLIEEVAVRRPGWTLALNTKTAKGYLPLVWSNGDRQIYFGFEPGDNWKRWRAILREARYLCVPMNTASADGEPAKARAKAILPRTSEQTPIPADRWEIAEELHAASHSFLEIPVLEVAETAMLYAGRTLYLDAVAGDLPYPKEEVVAFLVRELEPFWQRLEKDLA